MATTFTNSGITTNEPVFSASLIVDDWDGDEIGSPEEHWETEAQTRRRSRPQVWGGPRFTNGHYDLTVATTVIMGMEAVNERETFVWLIVDGMTNQELARGYASDAVAAMCGCELRMDEIAARDRA